VANERIEKREKRIAGMPYRHACDSCDGRGRRERRSSSSGVREYEFFIPLEGGPPTGFRRMEQQPAGPDTDDACRDCGGTGVAAGHIGADARACAACRQAEADRRPLVGLLRTHLRPARKLHLTPVEDARSLLPLGTHFGGRPYAEKGESWPVCPSCKKSLTFIGQFEAERVRFFTVFYCWECAPSGLDDDSAGSWVVRTYSTPDLSKLARIQPAEAPARETVPCEVRVEPISSHPDWDEVSWRFPELRDLAVGLAPAEPCSPYKAAVEETVGEYAITTQLGGYARWIQGAPRHGCRVCKAALEFVLQIDSLCEADCDWGLSGLAYLLACPVHPGSWALEIQRT
jgi:hypothetical protein